ncbi:hypothetical protein DFP72DRAFT_917207, partial [Ephemerocybe angulata]
MATKYDLTHVGNVIARAMAGYMAVSLVVLGIQLFMCIYGLTVFLETPRTARKGRVPYIIINFVLFFLLSISALMDARFLFRLLFESTSPKDFIARRQNMSDEMVFASQVLNLIVIFIGDAVMLWRCYMVWAEKRWVIILPCIIYVGSLILGILGFVPILRDLATSDGNLTFVSIFVFLSVTTNILVTILISSRLVHARRRLSGMLGDSNKTLGHFTGIVAILIESAVPLSVFGLGYAIVLAITKNGDPKLLQKEVANYVFSVLYYSFAALSPQMIIFRVTTGRSWVGYLHKSVSGTSWDGNTKSIAFAHTHPASCGSIAEERRSFSPRESGDRDGSE